MWHVFFSLSESFIFFLQVAKDSIIVQAIFYIVVVFQLNLYCDFGHNVCQKIGGKNFVNKSKTRFQSDDNITRNTSIINNMLPDLFKQPKYIENRLNRANASRKKDMRLRAETNGNAPIDRLD